MASVSSSDSEMDQMFAEDINNWCPAAPPPMEYAQFCPLKDNIVQKIALYDHRVAAAQLESRHDPRNVRHIKPPIIEPPPEKIKQAKEMVRPKSNLNGRSRSRTCKNIATNLAINDARRDTEARKQAALYRHLAPPDCMSLHCMHRKDSLTGISECRRRSIKKRKKRFVEQRVAEMLRRETTKVPVRERIRAAAAAAAASSNNAEPRRHVGPLELPPEGTFE